MAGTVTQSGELTGRIGAGLVQRRVVAWTSDASGNADGNIGISGTLLRVAFKPDTGDSQPTNLYDVTLTDYSGIDVLNGAGANLSNAAASATVPLTTGSDGVTMLPTVVSDTLTLNVTNAGNAKRGELILYFR